jgi:hypothetical protein
MRVRGLAALTLATLALTGAACSSSDGGATAAQPTQRANPPADLATVPIRPDGYEPIPNDPLSGPLDSPASVRNFFAEHKGDASTILNNGFRSGYAQYWRHSYSGSVTSPEFLNRPTTFCIVIEFASPDNARAVRSHFHQRATEDHHELFPVPGSLTDGYGYRAVQPGQTPDLTTYLYGVFWVQESRVFDVGMIYFTPPGGPSEVIERALAQSRSR